MHTLRSDMNFAYAARQNLRVIGALAVRELATRYGQNPLNYFWGLAEPAALIGIYLVVHTLAKAHGTGGDSIILFMITGIMTFRMTRGISGKVLKAISSNQPLLTYPNVKPLDTIIARATIESLIWLIVCLIFFTAISVYLDKRVIVHKDEFALALLAVLFFSFSLGAFNAVISILVPFYSNIWNMMGLPLLLASGILYVAAEMPPQILNILVWNPFLHCVEWVRIASYLDYHTVLDREYLLTVSSILLTVALVLERMYRTRLMSE
ncbi:ABC transporter permease [Rhizobiaceae bacterium n13]|uniref:ABC transporter permease n=1 Tax=Ferirhizobium litorale TaxID=2927786 RepID=A0AAE3Q7R2_9HYPH|nr:ABC transporter permease [Fererhizobium litorale]MDI7860649.1 ABC transporter permease [Fererhizobium litorale]MDI7920797.1 ABC transporter permease [Fererhizobium litorale]